jgi:hypothetical protein
VRTQQFFFVLLLSLLTLSSDVAFGQNRRRPSRPAAPAAPAAAPTPFPVLESMQPTEVARGGSVIFRGQNLPTNLDEITVYLNGNKIEKAVRATAPDKTSFIFAVPNDIDLGKYNVRVDLKINKQDVPFTATIPNDGMLTVFSEFGKSEPKITGVYPLVSYPEDSQQKDKKIYGFDVVGEGFSTRSKDNGLVINQTEIPVCWSGKDCSANAAKGEVKNSQQLHFEWMVPDRFMGGTQVQVRVGQTYSPPFAVTLSRVTLKFPKYVSIAVMVGFFGLVFWLLSGGFRNVIAGRKYSILSALFLDQETETYSLSRLQFFIWTAVAILTYLYLLLSRSLVQGHFEFVDVPSGLPGIILISGGTTVMAQAITKSKGSKGAGEIHPSLADLVSTGGVVVPERFQFFIWTILGAAAFVFIVFLNDPGTIQDLPSVPSGFLQLMGVSSAGYLGGKIARRAGPVIDEIMTKVGSLEFILKGRNLSKDANFRIGDQEIPSDRIESGFKPEIMEADTEGEPNTGKMISLKIKNPDPSWLKDNSELTIINPDGQKATLNYAVGPFVIDPVKIAVNQDAVIGLTIKGENLSDKTKVTIQTVDGFELPADESKIEFKSPDTLQITGTRLPQSGNVVITNPDSRSQSVRY